jgi:hypothetical protein
VAGLANCRGGVPRFIDALRGRSPVGARLIKLDPIETPMASIAADRTQLARISINL